MNQGEERAHTALQRAARGVETVVAVVSRVAIALAGATCLATLAMVCYAIITRYFFNRPQSWSDEAVGWMIVISVMLAIPEAQRRGEVLGVFSVAAVGYLLVTEGIEMVVFTRMIGIVSNVLPEVPLWAIQAMVPIGGALLLMVTLAQLFCLLAGLEPRSAHKDVPDALE